MTQAYDRVFITLDVFSDETRPMAYSRQVPAYSFGTPHSFGTLGRSFNF